MNAQADPFKKTSPTDGLRALIVEDLIRISQEMPHEKLLSQLKDCGVPADSMCIISSGDSQEQKTGRTLMVGFEDFSDLARRLPEPIAFEDPQDEKALGAFHPGAVIRSGNNRRHTTKQDAKRKKKLADASRRLNRKRR